MKLSQSNEDAIIETICSRLSSSDQVIVGPGDDCAVVRRNAQHHSLLKTDCVIESVHFLPQEDPKRVGWKAAARVISDIAAMGGTPEHLLVTVMLRKDTNMLWLESLYQGLEACASHFHTTIVGGETSSLAPGSMNAISIAGTGRVRTDQFVLRSTAQEGDQLFVTGELGGSLSGHHLDFIPRLAEAQHLVQQHKPNAMMDLSDGLAKDLPRLCKLSQLGYTLDRASLPCRAQCSVEEALNDGEDYELLFSIAAADADDLMKRWPKDLAPLTHIGTLHAIDANTQQLPSGGWDHFA
ncbi:thiamine-phosphate kinase [Rubritalea marina]|uniref:thiamine-phosphate kinase n=1 Tax=Rubritalea marina TaxID=361055 RepID=UPI00036DCA3E|nr:thiamine-phosphate kinase [Rubritalea marina]